MTVGWAMPTDHLQPKQKDFKLFNLYTNRSILTLSILILLNQKWSVGNAHPTKIILVMPTLQHI
jgi:hypothetical protein